MCILLIYEIYDCYCDFVYSKRDFINGENSWRLLAVYRVEHKHIDGTAAPSALMSIFDWGSCLVPVFDLEGTHPKCGFRASDWGHWVLSQAHSYLLR